MQKILFVFFLLVFNLVQAQFYIKSDSLDRKRAIGASILGASIFSSSNILLSKIWYDDFSKTNLHSFDDSKNWLQMDKLGHAYASYHFSQQISKMYRWSGICAKKSAIIGAASAWAYQFSIELLDGKSAGWGFSWSDIAANSLGSGLYLGQEYAFNEQIFKLKFSYFPSEYAKYRPLVLGSSFSEKLLKDYNAQTYWISFSPIFFLKEINLPRWINLAIGYSADKKIIGDSEFYVSEDGSKTLHSTREIIFSLDIDVKKLKVKKQWVKSILAPFNSIKIPFPAIIFSNGIFTTKSFY